MTKTMREAVQLLDAHKTRSDVPEMASTRIRTALTFLVDCVHTSAGIRNGELRPNAGKLRLTGHADAAEMHRRRAELALQAFASNLPRAAQAIAISAAHNAMSETFGALPDPDELTLSEVDTLRWFVYVVQCCYTHDPLRPKWSIDAPHLRRRFQFPALGIDIDTSTLDGQRFDPLIIGGTGGFMRLVDHCRKVIEADAATGDEADVGS
jgi:hypothetical protein